MKSFLIFVVAALFAGPALSNEQLARKKNCMACHAMSKRLIGPTYKEIAKKHRGEKGAVEYLTVKVLKGGRGVWGNVPMPPNKQVSPAEARQLVDWMLSIQ